MLGLICSHAWYFIMDKYNFVRIDNVFFMSQERDYVLHQDYILKILTSPRFTFIFDHSEQSLAGKYNENLDTSLMFDQFTISFIFFNIFDTCCPNSIILIICSTNGPDIKFIRWCKMKEILFGSLL